MHILLHTNLAGILSKIRLRTIRNKNDQTCMMLTNIFPMKNNSIMKRVESNQFFQNHEVSNVDYQNHLKTKPAIKVRARGGTTRLD